MKKAVAVRLEKIVPGVLTIKRFIRRRLEEQLAELERRGAPREKLRRVRIKLRGYRNRIAEIEKKRGSGDPPVFGELLLLLLLPEKDSEYQLGDLAEEYRRREKRRGRVYADLWFYTEVAQTAWFRVKKALWWIVAGLLTTLISDIFGKFIAGLF